MMTGQLDMTAQLASIPHGLAIALAISIVGIVCSVGADEVRAGRNVLTGAYLQVCGMLRRHLRLMPHLTTGTAH